MIQEWRSYNRWKPLENCHFRTGFEPPSNSSKRNWISNAKKIILCTSKARTGDLRSAKATSTHYSMGTYNIMALQLCYRIVDQNMCSWFFKISWNIGGTRKNAFFQYSLVKFNFFNFYGLYYTIKTGCKWSKVFQNFNRWYTNFD